jgi:hypothetical protein
MPKIKQNTFLVHSLSVALCTTIAITFAHADEAQSDRGSWVGVVSSDGAAVRCGANDSYYPVAVVKTGDMVVVTGKRQDWLKIETSGRVFNDAIGYIEYPTDNTATIVVNGNTGEALTDTEVLGNNIESQELYLSWRSICMLAPGEKIEIISSETTDPGTLHRESYVVHTVKMPDSGSAWIHTSNLRRATESQVAAYYGADEDGSRFIEISLMSNNRAKDGDGETSTSGSENIDALAQNTAGPLEPITLAELEARWDTITTEPIMGAELSPLLSLYSELLSADEGDLVVERVAGGRIKQLRVWERLQGQRIRINSLKEKMAIQSGDVDEYKSIMSVYGEYTVIGKLALSNMFDGKIRPFMFRVLDQKSGRTLGYLPVNKEFELSSLLGQTVGIRGENIWDPTWRVNVVGIERFDILSPTTAIVTPDIQ